LSSPAPTRQPILPVIQIVKNDSTIYNYNPFTSTFDFKVQTLQCSPAADAQGGKFTLKIIPPAGVDVSTMNAILGNIENGNQITIWIGKSNSSLTKVFLGVLENITVDESGPNYMQITLDGPDWGSDILKNRICLYYKVQRYLADNITYDPNDPNVTIVQILTDLLTSTLAYPFNDITVANQGIVFSASNVDTSIQNVRIPQMMANLEHLDDKLSELDNWCNAVHYVDANKNYIMKPAVSNTSPTPATGTWLFTDSVSDSLIASWTTGNVGYISLDGSSYKYTTENYKHRIIGIGSSQVSIDGATLGTPVQQTTNSGSTTLDSTHWLAQQFKPIYATGYSVAIFLATVGTPTVDIIVEIVQDNAGKPTGQVLQNLSIPRSQVAPSPGGWNQINIGVSYLTPSAYWIVIPPNVAFSGIASFQWYYGGSTFTNGISTDGINWTINSSSYGYMFINYTSTPLKIAIPGIGLNATDKVFHEETYRQAFITNSQALTAYLNSITKITNFKKEIYNCKVYCPDNTPLPFASILLRKILSGLQFNTSNVNTTWSHHMLATVRINFQASDSEATGTFWIDCQLVRFTTFP